MNTAAIAQHLNVLESAITEVQEWARVLWVRVKGLGARFVSKKVVEVKQMEIECQLSNGTWFLLTEQQFDQKVELFLEREEWYAPRKGRNPMTTKSEVVQALLAGQKLSYGSDWYDNIRVKPEPKPLPDIMPGMVKTQGGEWIDEDEYDRLQEMGIDA